MYIPIISFILAGTIASVVFLAAKVLSMRTMLDREKTSPFECGFEPKSNARVPFSMRFFMLAIIFIVFDIEIVLLMPLPLLNNMMNSIQGELAAILFLVILLLGLFHEWKEGSLNWSS